VKPQPVPPVDPQALRVTPRDQQAARRLWHLYAPAWATGLLDTPPVKPEAQQTHA
jgi:hypothetical protein